MREQNGRRFSEGLLSFSHPPTQGAQTSLARAAAETGIKTWIHGCLTTPNALFVHPCNGTGR